MLYDPTACLEEAGWGGLVGPSALLGRHSSAASILQQFAAVCSSLQQFAAVCGSLRQCAPAPSAFE
eukprot:9056604-Alexandrium_andersonii.AAC.1